MLRLLDIEFKVANVNHPSWKWSNNPNKSDKNDAHRRRKNTEIIGPGHV